MYKASKAALLFVCAALSVASGPSWTSKPPKQWSETDAKQLLSDSPWVRKATPVERPLRNENETRNSGLMGSGQGVDIETLSPAAFIGAGTRHRARPKGLEVEIRWESALPVRAAELRAREEDLPEWEGSLYVIAVYDVPGLSANQTFLAKTLSKEAWLKMDGRKDIKPVGVNLLPQEGGLTTVVYLFPRSEEITAADQRVEFDALFGRLALAQYFYPSQMRFQGRLEL